MRSLTLDFKFALRGLMRSPLFTVVALGSLALGIGANTAIFTLTNQILLRPLPVEKPDQLVLFDWDGTFSGRVSGSHVFSYPMYSMFRDKNPGLFSGLMASSRFSIDLGVQGVSERVNAEIVSGNYFDVLGVKPVLGRRFTPEDDRVPGGHPLVMLSYAYWQKRFGGRPSILNRKVEVNGHPMTVIGIAPQSFQGIEFGQTTEVFVPMMMKAQVTPTWNDLDNHRSLWLHIIGRLKPGVAREQAKAAMTVLYRQQNADDLKLVPNASERFRKRYVQNTLSMLNVSDGLSDLRKKTSTPLVVLTVMVGTLLLVACVNLASLLIARGTARQREIAIRLSVGASKGAIVRLVLLESLVLSTAGALLGLLVGAWCSNLLLKLMPSDSASLILSTVPDSRVLLFTLGLALVTALLFGIAPAIQAGRADLAPTLKAEAGNVTSDGGRVRFRKVLITGQIALSLLLLIGAGLFARSLFRLLNTNAGFREDNLIQFAIDPSLQGYTPERVRQLFLRVQQQIRQMPGVTSISSSETALIAGDRSMSTVTVEGYQAKEGEDLNPDVNGVGSGFLSTMGIPLLKGRDISERDGLNAPKVAVVNEAFADYFFKRENPLGRRFTFGRDSKVFIEIVGVCGNIKSEDLRQKPVRLILLPDQQDVNPSYAMFYVRTTRDPNAMVNMIRSQMRQIDSALPIFDMKTFTAQIDETHFVERAIALLSVAFGCLATLLASIGLYGVMAYSVARRTRELGIRIALGAQQQSVLWNVMREVLLLTTIGIVVAIPLSLSLGKYVQSQLFEMKASDPLTLILATMTIVLVCLLAGFIPAYRASLVDPVQALRYE